jgi:arachidonate 15-lipoxygenase
MFPLHPSLLIPSLLIDFLRIPVQPCLREKDPEPSRREPWLIKNRRTYQYDHSFWQPIPLLNVFHHQLPIAEWASVRYLVPRIVRTLFTLVTNQVIARIRNMFDRVDQIQDYKKIFTVLPRPKPIDHYNSDQDFVEQRLSGANPVAIRRLDAIPAGYETLFQQLQADYGDLLDLDTALKQRELFIIDYSGFAFVSKGSYQNNQQYLPAPVALFWLQKQHGLEQLQPLGICLSPKPEQMGPSERYFQPAEPAPVWITPRSEASRWKYAKLCLQTADANHHELVVHLFRTHLAMEPFAIATARQLARNHPLGLLLRPHFRFMMFNGFLARTRLLGYIDRLLAGTPSNIAQILQNAHSEWRFDQFAFPKEIANRGMSEIQHYPYRDDGLLIWEAVHKFVSNYLRLYYTDETVKSDPELQNWASELASPTQGAIKDFKPSIETVEELIEIVTNVIFTCGPQHSAINSPQYDYMTYMPNMPLALYQPIRPDADVADDGQLMPFLPPRLQATEQLALLYIVAVPYFYERLGQYDRKFADPRAQACVKAFQDRLQKIETEIEQRNQYRPVEYPYFKPSLILNSISM